MIQFYRFSSTSDLCFAEFWGLYQSAFPLEERRSLAAQQAAMREPDLNCFYLSDEKGFVGLVTCWFQGAFAYIEHLAVAENRRREGWGHEIITSLKQKFKRPHFLEIEIPEDADQWARQHFYEDCGYVVLDCSHQQLPFHCGQAPLPLRLMSEASTSDDLRRVFQFYLTSYVMIFRDYEISQAR